jgi:NADH:ubiquinone oxidoreductase subunit K
MIFAAFLGGLGMACMLMRATLLGVLIGVQLLLLGATMVFVVAGVRTGAAAEGHLFALFITLSGVAQLVVGYALSTRLFYLRNKAGMDDIRSLKH